MNDKLITVLGAGTMGADIALDLACYNYKVILKDIEQKELDSARSRIENDFRFYKMMKPSIKELDFKQIEENITFQLDYKNVEDSSLIIENISEDWNSKKNLYGEIHDLCTENMLIAINTSCISITKIGALLPFPENVIGMHFMNPVPLKEMVEVVKGFHTTDETIEKGNDFLKSIKKTSVVVNDYPGFVANRLSHLFMNEAAFLIQDNVAEPKQIDAIFKKGYGHKMGPLETADLIGLDTVVNSLNILYESYQDTKFRCCPLLKKMVDAGLYGKKSGEGFYKY
ncbi:MAG: 3-hydroxyacyl-CoA dehydrogenase family protein [bacterium]|nr:3-hydroxyacyl-CoA dehydrogenase family protein [bacterium]